MSYSVDVNILLYASDEAAELHESARAFLKQCANGPEILYLSWLTVMSYLRISTHPAIFLRPLSPQQAMDNLESLVNRPHVRFLAEGDRYWELYRESAQKLLPRGNAVPDLQLATLLRENGIRTLYTTDADFKKFDFIEAINPFVGE